MATSSSELDSSSDDEHRSTKSFCGRTLIVAGEEAHGMASEFFGESESESVVLIEKVVFLRVFCV